MQQRWFGCTEGELGGGPAFILRAPSMRRPLFHFVVGGWVGGRGGDFGGGCVVVVLGQVSGQVEAAGRWWVKSFGFFFF